MTFFLQMTLLSNTGTCVRLIAVSSAKGFLNDIRVKRDYENYPVYLFYFMCLLFCKPFC